MPSGVDGSKKSRRVTARFPRALQLVGEIASTPQLNPSVNRACREFVWKRDSSNGSTDPHAAEPRPLPHHEAAMQP